MFSSCFFGTTALTEVGLRVVCVLETEEGENIKMAPENVCVCLCATVSTGTLCSFKVSELDWFGRVREGEWEGAVSVGTFNGWELCVCVRVDVCLFQGCPVYEGINPVGV